MERDSLREEMLAALLPRDWTVVDAGCGDGYLTEISEGDLDMAEWYLLNSPRPGMGRQTPQTARGRQLFTSWGCDRCAV